MFFKLSFHYEELKKKNFLGRFWDNVEKIKNYPLLLPDKKIFNDFQIQAKGFFDKISLNTKEILSLQQMRDLLLKKIFE